MAAIAIGKSKNWTLNNAPRTKKLDEWSPLSSFFLSTCEYTGNRNRRSAMRKSAKRLARNNPKSIADSVTRLIDDVELKDRIVFNARAMVKGKYDWSSIAKNMDNKVFRKVMQH